MFASKNNVKSIARLRSRAQFLRVQSHKTKWVSKGLIIEIRPNEDAGIHFGITVSKRVSKLAVTRNRVKRRLRAVVYDVLPDYVAQHYDIVVIGRATTQAREYEDLRNDLRWCLKKLNILPDIKS